MMYISSDTGVHGFAMNENCYAYIKFVSGENEIKGDQYSLQQFDFNPSQWHVMKIKVIDKKTKRLCLIWVITTCSDLLMSLFYDLKVVGPSTG